MSIWVQVKYCVGDTASSMWSSRYYSYVLCNDNHLLTGVVLVRSLVEHKLSALYWDFHNNLVVKEDCLTVNRRKVYPQMLFGGFPCQPREEKQGGESDNVSHLCQYVYSCLCKQMIDCHTWPAIHGLWVHKTWKVATLPNEDRDADRREGRKHILERQTHWQRRAEAHDKLSFSVHEYGCFIMEIFCNI